MKLFSKEELITDIKRIFAEGWHKSIKTTIDSRNDGAVGNTLLEQDIITEQNLDFVRECGRKSTKKRKR